MGETLLFRADANASIGTGHVMRCLALAQAWQDRGGTACFVAAEMPQALRDRLAEEGVSIQQIERPAGSAADAYALAAVARQLDTDLVVLDGYHFGSEYQKALKEAGLWVLALDDCGVDWPIYADAVLNQNIQANEALYPRRRPETALLLGTRYVLLRREFLTRPTEERQHRERACNLLVTMGGSDPHNTTTRFLNALAQEDIRDLDIRVAVGGGNPHRTAIQAAIRNGGLRGQILTNVRDMPSLMTWADLAVSAGGSTCWELAFMGLPSILLGLADNQRPAVELLDSQGVFLGFPTADSGPLAPVARAVAEIAADPIRRVEISRRGQELVDAQGANRICKYWKERGR